jgi:hypothetical protein
MQAAFSAVVWIVCGVGIVVALALLATSGKAWEEYANRGLLMDHERVRGVVSASLEAVASPAERETDIREMLTALSAGRVRRGEAAIDVDAEVARLTSSDTYVAGELEAPAAP